VPKAAAPKASSQQKKHGPRRGWGEEEAHLGRALVPSQKQQVGAKPPPAAAASSHNPCSTHRNVQTARNAPQQQQCKGVAIVKIRGEEKEKQAAPPPPARPPCHLGRHRAHTALGSRMHSGVRQVGEERTPRHRPSMGACELPLPYRPALKGASPTRQGCTPVAKSAAAKPDACKSNGSFSLAHVVNLAEYTARAAHVPLGGVRCRVGGGGGERG
jgi:hypothetical protein